VQAAQKTKAKVQHQHKQAKFITRNFEHSRRSIAASQIPIKKKKNWCQISDDYTQYLLGSTDTHFQTRSPAILRRSFFTKRTTRQNSSPWAAFLHYHLQLLLALDD
jgi:hypothetical protein